MVVQHGLILVTRPEPQASQWVQALQAAGRSASALPLIAIGPPSDALALTHAWQQLPQFSLVVMVSPNASTAFLSHRPAHAPWPPSTCIAAPGPGTQMAVHEVFVREGLACPTTITPAPDSPRLDSEHLWPQLAVHDWQGKHVLMVSGEQDGVAKGRTWLTTQLHLAGAHVQHVLAYSRQAAAWDSAQADLAATAYTHPASHVWLFSSSQSIEVLLGKLGRPPSGAHAIATHPRIADAALAAGFAHVTTTSGRIQDLIDLPARRLSGAHPPGQSIQSQP